MLRLAPSTRGCSPSISARGRMLSWENSLSLNVPAVRGQLVLGSAQQAVGRGVVLAGGAAMGLTQPGQGAPACALPDTAVPQGLAGFGDQQLDWC